MLYIFKSDFPVEFIKIHQNQVLNQLFQVQTHQN